MRKFRPICDMCVPKNTEKNAEILNYASNGELFWGIGGELTL